MAKQDLHFSITASNDDLKRKLAESRQAILGSAKTAEDQASRIDGSFKRMAVSAAAGFSAISLGKSIIRVRGEIQMMETSFEVLLGSKAKATKMIAEIKQLAIDSPLEMPQVSGAVQVLLGFGVEAEKVMGIVGQLSDVAMGDADRFRSLALVYAQTQSAGKLMGQDLLQMINAGFNPLSVIAEKTGKSIGQLKKEMESGAISAEMVADAFATVTSEGGMFYQMTQKQASGIVGLQATFEDAITKQMNKFGEKNEDLIASGYKFATSVVENADTIVAALIPIITTYGVYKASVIAVNAIGKVKESSFAAVEIAELSKLLPLKAQEANADITTAVAKGHLSQATAERLLAVRAEVQTELEGLRVKAQTLAQEAVAAAQAHKNALQRSVVARQNMALAQSQMQIAIQGGNAEEIAAAKTASRTAKLEVNSSAIAVNTTRQALGTTQSNANAAAIAVDTMQTNINTVATRSATTAKTLWTAATLRLTKAFHSLKLAFASNPIGMILTGVTMAISLFTMFGKSAEEASDQTDLLNKSIADLGIETAKEVQQIDNAFAKLLKAKKGTQEYGDAKDAIISKYGEYLRGLSAEVSSLNNVELAYNAVRNAAEDSIKARFKASFIEQANDDAAKKMGEAVKNITDNVKKGFSDDFLKQFPDQVVAINAEIVNALTSTERTLRQKQIDVGAILENYGFASVDATKMMRSMDFFDFGDRENFVETFEEAFQSSLNIANIANAAFDATTENQIKNGEKLETVLERRKRLTKELQDATSLLARMQSDSSTSSDTKIEAQKKKIKDLEQALNIDSKTTAKDYSSEVVEDMLKSEQLKLDVMRDGRTKELAQIEQTRKEKLAAIDKEQKEVADLIRKGGLSKEQQTHLTQKSASFEAQKPLVQQQATNDTAAVNKKYDDEIAEDWKALTAVFLSEEEKRTGAIKDRYDKERERADKLFAAVPLVGFAIKMQIDAAEAKEQLDALTADYQTYADQRKAIEEKFNADLTALQAKNKDGQLDGNIAEVEKQKRAALSKVKMDEMSDGVDFTKLFGNLDNLTLPSMKTLRDKIKAWIDEAGNSLAPEDLKAVSDAFQNLEIKIADKDPFAVLKSSAKELKTANEGIAEAQDKVAQSQIAAQNAANILAVAQQRVTSAQKEYNEALENNDPLKIVNAQAKLYVAQNDLNNANTKGVATTKKLKEEEQKLTQAQEDRAAAVVKANEAIGSIAEKGQQIVGAAQDVLGILSDLGVQVPENIANALGGIGQVMEGLGSIDLNKPLSIVTGAVKILGGLVKTITSLFNGDNKREAEIGQLQGKIDALGTSYDALQKAAEKAYSTDASGLIDDQNRMLEQQKQLIKNQIIAEQSKKNGDDDRIKEWTKQLEEIDQTIIDNRKKAVDAIFGSDLQSAIDNFASAYMDAWASGEDRAAAQKDVVKNMIRGIIQEMLKSDIKGSVEKMRKQIEGFMSDDVLSDWELAEIDKMGDQVGQIMEQRGKLYDKILKDDKPEDKDEGSLSGQIRGTVATEQSVAELGGIFRGQHERLSSIDRKMDLGITGLMDIARTNMLIELNTRRTADNTDGLRDTVSDVGKAISATNERLSQVIKNTKTDNGTL